MEKSATRPRLARKVLVTLGIGQLVTLAMLAVVASFSGALAYSQFRLVPIEEQALDIIDDAAPSIEHLSAARTELIRLGMYVSAYIAQAGNGHTVRRGDISEARGRLDAELARYRSLPDIPGEAELLAQIEGGLHPLDQATTKIVREVDAGSLETARLSLQEAFHPNLERTAGAIARLKTLNANHARTQAEGILAARRQAIFTSTGLGITSLVLALIATVLVVRVLRGRSRLLEERAQLLADRATELEAFAGRVAHDLKIPLTAAALRVLSAGRDRDINPKAREKLDRVTQQIERMDLIIDGLLEFARAGANPPPGARADLRAIIDEVISDVRPAAEGMNAELIKDPLPSVELACTPAALTSVLSNLLGNAVKYIGEGRGRHRRVSVHVRDAGAWVRVEVEDNGPGLPPGAEARVFEPFQRGLETKQPGFGLGLATVKKIVEAYNGGVGVQSRAGQGSLFWFELPKAASALRP